MDGIAEVYLIETNNLSIPATFEKRRGLPRENGVAAYFYEGGTVAVLPDEFGGADGALQTGVQSGTNSARLSGGGGVRLTASVWHTCPPIDVTLPFTIVSAGAIFAPLGATSGVYLTPIAGTLEISTTNRGFIWELRSGTAPIAGVPIESETKPEVSGTFATTVPPVAFPVPVADWVIGGYVVRALRHDGTGIFKHEIYKPSLGNIPVQRQISTYNLTTMTTVSAVQDKTLAPFIGGLDNATYGKGDMAIDLFAVWTESLSTVRMNAVLEAVRVLAAARGRSY